MAALNSLKPQLRPADTHPMTLNLIRLAALVNMIWWWVLVALL